MNPFTDHPASVGESYGRHWRVATRFGCRMIAGGLGTLVHGICPFLFTATGSRTVEALQAEIVAKRAAARAAETQLKTVEFVI